MSPGPGEIAVPPHRPRSAPVAWTLAAGIVGIVSSALFSSQLHLPRPAFVAAHGVVTFGFAAAYLTLTRTDPASEVRSRWAGGLVVGTLTGLLLVRGVMMQPGSAEGTTVGAMVWLGLVYGVVDALLLNVVPVHVFLRAASGLRSTVWRLSALALGASLLVTTLYHMGFPEFRGSALLQPLFGNTIITASYLVSRNPLAPIVSHVMMHAAAVVHGIGGTFYLPPHY